MKQKKAILLSAGICLLVITLCIPNSTGIISKGFVKYYYNADVLVIGRCRSTGSTDDWHGGLFIGEQTWACVEAGDTPLERLNVFVRNESSQDSFRRLINYSVQFNNASGIFFCGRKGGGPAAIPPFVFVRCHAELVVVHEKENISYCKYGSIAPNMISRWW